jgi:hypothetical protein
LVSLRTCFSNKLFRLQLACSTNGQNFSKKPLLFFRVKIVLTFALQVT